MATQYTMRKVCIREKQPEVVLGLKALKQAADFQCVMLASNVVQFYMYITDYFPNYSHFRR